jgi:hypothetical protein
VVGFIDHLCTQLVSTSNYSAITDLHISQITRARTKSSQSAFTSCFLVADLNNGDSSASVFMSLSATELIVPTGLVVTSRHGPHRKHHSSLIAAGTCLPSCCLETVPVYSRSCCIAMAVHAIR